MEYSLREIKDGTGWAPDQRFTTVERHNGWKNYETWVTALWIDNDEWSYTESRERVSEYVNNLDDEEERSPSELGDQLKEWAEEIWIDQACEGSGLAADLLRAAWSDVDWTEIAENWLSEL